MTYKHNKNRIKVLQLFDYNNIAACAFWMSYTLLSLYYTVKNFGLTFGSVAVYSLKLGRINPINPDFYGVGEIWVNTSQFFRE